MYLYVCLLWLWYIHQELSGGGGGGGGNFFFIYDDLAYTRLHS